MVLKELCNLYGVSGNEGEVRNFIRNEIKDYVDEIKVDCLGNLMVKKRGRNCSKQIMFLAHMDEVGLMVEKIEKNGTIKFQSVGGILPSIFPATNVKILGKETLSGVIGIQPIHLQKSVLSPIKMDSLYIDCGANSDTELNGKIEIGDYITFITKFSQLGDLWEGKAFDDRVGCSIMIDILKENITPEFDTWFVFATQEEVGLRGSITASYHIKPDFALVLEGTTACDIPLVERNRYTTQLGKGPAISIAHNGLVFGKKVFTFLKNIAEQKQIPFQVKEKISGGNDATRIAKAEKGTFVGSVSVPVRYIHSPTSVMHPEDYINTQKLAMGIFNNSQNFFNQ
ncbi:MAG: M42 family peptidase [Caldisericia bacterium]|nr:M42 family peptidase [Caldisericia bacterium]